MINFHTFVKGKRLEREITLREFCREIEADPSNWSKIERGIADPPKTKFILNNIIATLNLDWYEAQTLIDLAMIESIPTELRPKENIFQKLPLIFKLIRGDKPTEQELRKLIKVLMKS